jgi:hypothetical protein
MPRKAALGEPSHCFRLGFEGSMGGSHFILQGLVALAFMLLAISPGFAQTKDARVALVIGNGAYSNVTPLKNAAADANAVAESLGKLGFGVTRVTNASRAQMNEAIGVFLDRAGPNTDAVIYFAGHGVELAGANYLLPIDVPALRPGQERLLRAESINLTELLLDLEGRQSRVSVVILDACRDNPFPPQGTRSIGATRGLARVDPPAGAFVIFSAGAGEQALDVLGPDDRSPNGVFTRRFLALINEPALELRQMTLKLRSEVSGLARGVNHKQMPSYYDQMSGSFFFRPQGAPVQSASAASPPSTAAAQPAATRSAADGAIYLTASRVFNNPQIDGKSLDWCRVWAKECGFPAADEFCRQQGSPGARVVIRKSATDTRLIGDGQGCTGNSCSSFSSISCTPASLNRQVPPDRDIILHERHFYDTQCNSLGVPRIVVEAPPASGKVETHEVTFKVRWGTGAYAHCNGKDLPGVRLIYRGDANAPGPVRVEFRSRTTGYTDMQIRADFEIVK